MFCENCGTQLPDNSAFCQECGSKVSFAEPGSTGQRGPVPPFMRQTAPRQPFESYEQEMTPRRPAEPYVKETVPRQPSEPYEKEMENRKPKTRNKPASDRREYNKTNYQATDIISFGQYVLMFLLSGIPIINVILFVKWGFSDKQKPNKSNFAKALLLFYLIAVLISVVYGWLWLKATSSI